MWSPNPIVHIDDYNGFVANMLNLVVGHHGPEGMVVFYAEPMVKLVGAGPVYHPFSPPYVPPAKKTTKAEEDDYDDAPKKTSKAPPPPEPVDPPDECAWIDPDSTQCGRPQNAHETPRLEPKLGEWMITQKVISPDQQMPDGAFFRVPRQWAREIGEALVEWADKNVPLKATDIEVTREALLVERARVDKMLEALIGLAENAPKGELFSTEVQGS